MRYIAAMKHRMFLIVACQLTCLATGGFASGSTEMVFPENRTLVEDQTFNTTLSVYGSEFDGLVIRNCLFEDISGPGLDIRGADGVVVENCVFRNIRGNGINLQGTEPTEGIIIHGNDLRDIYGNGIFIRESHSGVMVSGNEVYNVGLDLTASRKGMPHHGIYCQGRGFTITGNLFIGVVNPGGHGISLRSWGLVSGNTVGDIRKSGISYYPDHPGTGGELIIYGNTVSTAEGNGIRLSDNGATDWYVRSVRIRDNILNTRDSAVIVIDDFPGVFSVALENNAVHREDGGGLLVWDKRTDS